MKKYCKESILAPLFKMLEALFDLFVPIVVARIINVGIMHQDKGYIARCCGLLVLMALIGLLCSFTAQYFAAKAATGCATGLRHDLFAHIQTLGFSEVDTIGTSTLITRMTSDINQVQNGLNLFLRLFLRSPFIVVGAMVMAFMIQVKIALIFAVAIPVLAVIVFGIMRWTSPLYKKIQGRLDEVMGVTRENLSGVRVIRAFGKEEAEVERFHQANGDLVAMQLHVGHISALMNPLTYVVVNLGIIAILNMGASAVDGGVLLSGDIVALVNYMSQILVELVKLANLVVSLSRAMASLSRVESVLDTEPSMKYEQKCDKNPAERDAEKCAENPAERDVEKYAENPATRDDNDIPAVVFDHVGLIYAGAGDESLSDISFAAKRGQTIGVIGGTGSGKSSLVSLIPRFYDATAGKVMLYGTPITEWSQEELRKRVSVVMQKAQLFSGTIRSNLLWGGEDAADEQLWNALRIAQAEEFVRSKPGALDEPVEQGGRNLSGGQKQRLTIARALVSQPDILILDDSASALDYATDAALRQSLKELPEETTVFIVSQRTSSIQHADQILVLDDGKLMGCGTHEELLAQCEIYREIYESQFKKGDDRHE
jgi:ABC-type multidrug transport system fused ATPase/permease subunit